jgi:hypothetical protein
MTDPVEDLIKSIRDCRDVQQAHFTGNFLNTVAEVFERDGFGATRAFLLDKRQRQDLRQQASAMLAVLDLMGSHPEVRQRRAIGRVIIKTLVALKSPAVGRSGNQRRGSR